MAAKNKDLQRKRAYITLKRTIKIRQSYFKLNTNKDNCTINKMKSYLKLGIASRITRSKMNKKLIPIKLKASN